MSLHREQIHTLLAEIDGVLNKASPRLPWVMSSEVNQQRQTLENLRRYLVTLDQNMGAVSPEQSNSSHPSEAYWGAPAPLTHLEVSSTVTAELIENATTPQMALNLSQQMIQQFAQDIGQLRSSLLHPLHTELGRLQQQRETLLQEIRQLERQRQQHSLVQQRASQEQVMQDFLQGLMERLQERLSQQISQMVNSSAVSQGFSPLSLGDPGQNLAPLFPQEVGLPPLPPAQRMEQAQMLQSRADQVMVTLDTTLRVFAEALQQNIQSYESSLSQGLEKMHRMGQQGEAIVSGLVQKLADQVSGQVSLNEGEIAPSRSLSSSAPPPVTQTSSSRFSSPPVGQITTLAVPKPLPYAGAEMPDRSDRSSSRLPNPARPSVTAAPSLPSPPPELKPELKPESTPLSPLSSGFSAPKDTVVMDQGLGDSDLENLDWDGAEADLELDLDLLGHLEDRSIVSETIVSETIATPEPGVVNEELDAFYASLFGDQALSPTLSPPIALDTELDAELDAELTDGLADGLDLPSPLDSPRITLLAEADDRTLDTQDFFADFSAGLSTGLNQETIAQTILESDSEPLTEPVEPRIVDLSDPNSPADRLGFTMDPALAELEQALQAVMMPTDRQLPESPLNLPSNPPSSETAPDSSPLSATLSATLPALPEVASSLESIPGSHLAIVLQPQQSPDPTFVPQEDIITALTDLLEHRFSVAPSPPISPEKTIDRGASQPAPNPPLSNQFTPHQPLKTQPLKTQNVLPEDNLRIGEEEAYPPALPEEILLVKEDGDDSIKAELALEPETLQQLREDLSNLERQENLRLEDVTNLPLSDVFGSNTIASDPLDPLVDPFADFNDEALSEVFNSAEALDIDLLEEEPDPSSSSASDNLAPPAESLLPEPEEGDVEWLTQDPKVQETFASKRYELPNRDLSRDNLSDSDLSWADLSDSDLSESDLSDSDSDLSKSDDLSIDRMAEFFPDLNSFEESNPSDPRSPISLSQTLNQNLSNDPSLIDISEWFQTSLETIERSSGENRSSTIFADDLFEDLPNAEEKKKIHPSAPRE